MLNTGVNSLEKNISYWIAKTNLSVVEKIARSGLLQSILTRYGIAIILDSMKISIGDHGNQLEFNVVQLTHDKDQNYRALLRRRSIIEVETLSIAVACVALNDFDHSDSEDNFRDEPSQNGDLLESAICHAIDQLLNHLVCERNMAFGGCLKDLCVSDILIPSIASDVNSGLDMLLTSSIANSGSCSQRLVQAILMALGPSRVQELAPRDQPLIQEGVLMLLSNHLERKKHSHQLLENAPQY